MIRRIATVGGLTLVSRLTGFVRDVVMAAVLGAGPMADAFFIAFRLPNHFRAIFAEGAFAAAFVPAYARTLEEAGLPAAKLFADQIASALILINLVLLGLALLFTPWVVSVLAPGLVDDPARFDLGGATAVRPDVNGLLPVFVVDEYDGYTVKRVQDCTRAGRSRRCSQASSTPTIASPPPPARPFCSTCRSWPRC